MKRLLLIITALLMLLSAVLASCGDAEPQNGSFIASEGQSSSVEEKQEESSKAEINSSEEESSKAEINNSEEESIQVSTPEEDENNDEPPEGAVELLFTRFTEHAPTFVMVGKCAPDAVVTAQIGDESVTVDSYMGYFSVSFTKAGGLHDVTFTQTVDGEPFDIPRTYRAMPTYSKHMGEQAVIASNSKFQFFLSKMIPDFEGNNLYPDSVIIDMVSRIGSRVDSVKSYNPDAEVVYMIVPSPMTIYPELVPDFYTPAVKSNTRLDQVVAGLETSGATVIDLRDTFMAHKDDEMPLYYKLDSHWADYGAYLGYKELFSHIETKFPEAAPRPIDDFDWNDDFYKSCDVILYLDYPQAEVEEYAYYRTFKDEIPEVINTVPRYRFPPNYDISQLIYSEECTGEFVFETNRPELPSCMVYRDSYSASIFDLIPERMDTTHYVGMWNYAWNNYQIQNEQPDYIIYLVAEWNMDEIVYN